MAATIISNMPPYNWGMSTNQVVGRIVSLQQQLGRLSEAVSTASSGWEGTPGTQFEIGNAAPLNNQNLFGVVADTTTPGQKGQDYSYAIGQLAAAWATFWTAARPYIEQLDNGVMTM